MITTAHLPLATIKHHVSRAHHALHSKCAHHCVHHSSVIIHIAHLAFCVVAIRNTETLIAAGSVGIMVIEHLMGDGEGGGGKGA